MSQQSGLVSAPPQAQPPARLDTAARPERPLPLGNQARLRRLQAKLTIGAVDDPLEHEADAVAEQVMRAPDPALGVSASPPRISRQCAACGEEDKLQAKREGSDLDGGEAPAAVDAALRAPGRPLDAATRALFEPRFGADFSSVRVHSDGEAAKSARSVGALGYAVGRDIVFEQGRFAPGSDDGRRLIAHELAHVVQQTGEGKGPLRRAGDPAAAPMMLACPIAGSAAPQPTEVFLFPNNSSTFTDEEKTRIANFVDNWKSLGQGKSVRVDGFASTRGGEALNWKLSCDRASAVKDELATPSAGTAPGIPSGSIEIFMQGKTTEFGDEAQNRRVTLALPDAAPGQAAPNQTPKVPPDAPNQTPEDPGSITPPVAPANPPPTTKPPAASTNDCNTTQSDLIAAAAKKAQDDIAAVLPQLAASPLSADMQNALWLYFRDSSAATATKVSANLSKISTDIGKVTYECESSCPADELGYTRLGTMLTGAGNIHLCMGNLKQDAQSIADTITHEMAHYSLLATDSAGYFGPECAESDTTVSAGSSTKLDLADSYSCFVRNWASGNAADRADAKGDLTGANISGIQQAPAGPIDLSAPRKKPLFVVKLSRGPAAIITGVSYRWVFRDPQNNSYRMTDTSGNDLFDFKPSLDSVIAVLNTPTRDVLKQKGVTSGTVVVRATSPVFGDKVFTLPVTIAAPAAAP